MYYLFVINVKLHISLQLHIFGVKLVDTEIMFLQCSVYHGYLVPLIMSASLQNRLKTSSYKTGRSHIATC